MAPLNSGLPPVRAFLFDMDGLLIDSEDIYTRCTNTILREYGKPDLPWSIKAQLQGRPGPEAGAIFNEWAQLPIPRSVYLEKYSALQRELFPTTQPLPGAHELLLTLTSRTSPRVHIALATSSNQTNFKLKTAHLPDIFSLFPEQRIVKGDDPRIPAGKGKPAPDIYLLALECINSELRRTGEEPEVRPEECLVLEDAVPGVEAGRRAGMRVVWVPHTGLLREYEGREGEVLAGLAGEVEGTRTDEGKKMAADVQVDIKGKEVRSGDRIQGSPGRVGDGWGELLHSLEDFPYQRYGINIKCP